MSDLEGLLRNIFERTQRQRRNPSVRPSANLGLVDEIPIAITARDVGVLAEPIYGSYRSADPMVDYLENDGDSDQNLSAHTADSGEGWTALAGTITLKTEDYLIENDTVDALYLAGSRDDADMRLSIVMVLKNAGSGLAFRIQDSSNYWRFYAFDATEFRLERVSGGVPTDVTSIALVPAVGDAMMVEAVGDVIKVFVNNEPRHVEVNSNLNTQTDCGLYMANGSAARLTEFRAFELPALDLDFEQATRGHTFFGSFEEYRYLLEGSLTEKDLNLTVIDNFATPDGQDEDLGVHESDTGDSWTEQSGGFTVKGSGICIWDGGTVGLATVDGFGRADLRMAVDNLRGADRSGLVLRLSDTSNYWRVLREPSSGFIELQEVNAGSPTSRIVTAVDPDGAHSLMVEAIGNTYRLFVDNKLEGTYDDTSAFNATQTNHGLFGFGSGRFVNFKMWEIV